MTKRSILLEPGDFMSSSISLITATLGAGTIAYPYAIMMNGVLGGSILILVGGALSKYSAMLLVKVSDFTGKEKYDDMALALFNKRMQIFASVMNVMTLLSFVVAYLVIVNPSYFSLSNVGERDVPKYL